MTRKEEARKTIRFKIELLTKPNITSIKKVQESK